MSPSSKPRFYLGVDEAGYGPNLGPLLITATVWGDRDRQKPVPPGIADSKTLFHGNSIERLERGVLAAASVVGNHDFPHRRESVSNRADIHRLFEFPIPGAELELPPWEKGANLHLPLASADFETFAKDPFFHDLMAVHCRIVHPSTFNRLLETDRLKSTLLTLQTLELVRESRNRLPEEADVEAFCDKHGGRNSYAAALYEIFPDAAIEIVREGREMSVYRVREARGILTIRFEAKGESHPETALASMVSKYLRELSMRIFNDFWSSKIPGLKPTAGYPVDAKRFFQEIDAERSRLAIPLEMLWRKK